jgi:hypothetical protein
MPAPVDRRSSTNVGGAARPEEAEPASQRDLRFRQSPRDVAGDHGIDAAGTQGRMLGIGPG